MLRSQWLKNLERGNYSHVIHQLQKNEKKQDAEATFTLGLAYFYALGVEEDVVRAMELFSLAIKRGYERAHIAQIYLALGHYYGYFVEKNLDETRRILLEVQSKEVLPHEALIMNTYLAILTYNIHDKAQAIQAQKYLNNNLLLIIEPRFKQGYMVFVFKEINNLLAHFYMDGVLFEKSPETVDYYHTIARAIAGEIEAQYQVAIMYEYGHSIKKDDKKAIFWYLKACDQGHPSALEHMIEVYETGIIVNRNPKQAFNFAEQLSKSTSPFAWLKLADYYLRGFGTKKNRRKALTCFKNAAEYQSVYANEMLAKGYKEGLFGFPNYKKARYYANQAEALGSNIKKVMYF